MSSAIEIDPQKIDAIIERWHSDPSFVIEMLQDVQETYRHLPRAALEQVARGTKTDLARLYHIATFYKAFSTEPRGLYSVQVCTGTACHVRGAARSLDGLSRELGVAAGETTEDLRFTLESVRCLGCCSLAPVVAVGSDIHGDLDSSKVKRLVSKYKKLAEKREAGNA